MASIDVTIDCKIWFDAMGIASIISLQFCYVHLIFTFWGFIKFAAPFTLKLSTEYKVGTGIRISLKISQGKPKSDCDYTTTI